MPGTDPDHWLHRLSASEWLAAAHHELALAYQALAARGHRTGLTHARRAAGMALNAVLVVNPDDAYGRSYMEHLKALAADGAAPAPARDAARGLVEAPMAAPLVTLGRTGTTALADLARVVTDWAAARVGPVG